MANCEELDPDDRAEAIRNFSEEDVDSDFLPYLNRINDLPYAVTVQSCIGHLPYRVPDEYRPSKNTGIWGYLQLMLTENAAEWLSEVANWEWLWLEGSAIFHCDQADLPGLMPNGSILLAFAWDAHYWPKPAIDIESALYRYADEIGVRTIN